MRWISIVALVACSSKESRPAVAESKDVAVDELGVVVTVPGTWDLKQRGDGIAITGGGLDGVILRKGRGAAKTLEEARGELVQGGTFREEKPLPTGGFFFAYDVDFGTKDKPMVLPNVAVVLPTASGSVLCELQLQPTQDPAPIARACSSMRTK